MGAVHGSRSRKKWSERRIYVLWAIHTQCFKIGIAASPGRIHDVRACSPIELVLIGTRPGTLRDEFQMHQKLKEYRHHGEWFCLPESIVWALGRWLGRSDEIPSDIEVATL